MQSVEYVDAVLVHVTSVSPPQYYHAEPLLQPASEWRKFNDNGSYFNPESHPTAHAFSHYTYQKRYAFFIIIKSLHARKCVLAAWSKLMPHTVVFFYLLFYTYIYFMCLSVLPFLITLLQCKDNDGPRCARR